MEIRKAEFKDAEKLAEIFRNDLGEPDCTKELVLKKMQLLDDCRECVLVAADGDTVCGVIHAEIYNVLYFEPMCNILGLAVCASYRRMGVGKKLFLAAENWAKERNIKFMRINSGETRKEAHQFYRKMGCNKEKLQLRFLKEL